MSLVSIGSQSGDSPKTPTLRQYIQQHGGKCANRSTVTLIFPPGKYDTWSFLTDHGYRVSVGRDNPLYDAIVEAVVGWSQEDACLVVSVDDLTKASWSLSVDTDANSGWEVFEWGYKLSLQPRKKRDRTKTATI